MKKENEAIKYRIIRKYLNNIRPYFKDIINDLKKSDTWKIQLAIAINLISAKDTYKECV